MNKVPPKSDLFILAGLAFSLFLYHLISSAFSGYGYFIDELYFIACSKRLAFGYIDQPPLSIVMLAVSRWMLGDSLPAVRFLPALAMAANVFLTGLMARQLGGSRRAMIIAAPTALRPSIPHSLQVEQWRSIISGDRSCESTFWGPWLYW